MVTTDCSDSSRTASTDRGDPWRAPDALAAEIARLYQQLQAFNREVCYGPRRVPATAARFALEARIRELSRQHWLLVSGIAIGDAPPPALTQRGGPRKFFRTAQRGARRVHRELLPGRVDGRG